MFLRDDFSVPVFASALGSLASRLRLSVTLNDRK